MCQTARKYSTTSIPGFYGPMDLHTTSFLSNNCLIFKSEWANVLLKSTMNN